jgi:pentatricopeptide repeat protein
VREIQDRIEASDKFQALLKDGKTDPSEIKQAAREAAKKAAAKDGVHHPPLPSWVQDRMTYDWGDALIDDLMGNSADLTSSLSPYPIYMGGEYGRLRRKVERILRLKEEENVLLVDITGSSSTGGGKNLLSDRLISDLLRSHRDANGKRTTPIGLGPSLQLLFQDLNIPRSELGIQTYVSLLTCCQNPWEARKVNEMRQTDGIRSNEYFWSALVDVYARSGDYLGAENVLDEMLKETKKEYEQQMSQFIDKKSGQKVDKPIAIPPLPAYTSFLSSCYKLVSRPDVHPSIKSDAANRAWNRWKEMRIHR